ASVRRKLLMNLLELPVPFQLVTNIYPHNGVLQETAYRVPWGNKKSQCTLEVSGFVAEHSGSGQEKVVPSSNPSSQCKISLLVADIANNDVKSPWEESFSPCAPDAYSFNPDADLFLAEDVIFVDHLQTFKRHMPVFHSLFQRLKILNVSDPLPDYPHKLLLGRCASFEAVLDKDEDLAFFEENVTEEFMKEPLLNEESLMLPVEIQMDSRASKVPKFSFANLQDVTNVNQETIEECFPVEELLKK
ncbi:hypothetical protein DNTS_014384, partial [Danionella cerebrum]